MADGMNYSKIEEHLKDKRTIDDKLNYLWKIRERSGLLHEVTAKSLDYVLKETMYNDNEPIKLSSGQFPWDLNYDNAAKVRKLVTYMQGALKKGAHEKYSVLLGMAREQYSERPTLEVIYAEPRKDNYWKQEWVTHRSFYGCGYEDCSESLELRFDESSYKRDLKRYHNHNPVLRMIVNDYSAKKEIEEKHAKKGLRK